jgi:hypothetical protein
MPNLSHVTPHESIVKMVQYSMPGKAQWTGGAQSVCILEITRYTKYHAYLEVHEVCDLTKSEWT